LPGPIPERAAVQRPGLWSGALDQPALRPPGRALVGRSWRGLGPRSSIGQGAVCRSRRWCPTGRFFVYSLTMSAPGESRQAPDGQAGYIGAYSITSSARSRIDCGTVSAGSRSARCRQSVARNHLILEPRARPAVWVLRRGRPMAPRFRRAVKGRSDFCRGQGGTRNAPPLLPNDRPTEARRRSTFGAPSSFWRRTMDAAPPSSCADLVNRNL
jgi:hypothetical protein